MHTHSVPPLYKGDVEQRVRQSRHNATQVNNITGHQGNVKIFQQRKTDRRKAKTINVAASQNDLQ